MWRLNFEIWPPVFGREKDGWTAGISAAASTGRMHFPARMGLFTTAPTFLASRTIKQFEIRSLLARKVKGIFCWCSNDFLNLMMGLAWLRICVLTWAEIEAREDNVYLPHTFWSISLLQSDQNHCIPARFSLCQLLLIQCLISWRCSGGVTGWNGKFFNRDK